MGLGSTRLCWCVRTAAAAIVSKPYGHCRVSVSLTGLDWTQLDSVGVYAPLLNVGKTAGRQRFGNPDWAIFMTSLQSYWPPFSLPRTYHHPHQSLYNHTPTFIGRSSFIIQPMKIGPAGVPEMPAPNYFSTLRLTAHETDDFSSEDTIRIISETFAALVNVEGLRIQGTRDFEQMQIFVA